MNANEDRKKKIKRIIEIEMTGRDPDLEEEWRQLNIEVFGGVVDGGHQDPGEDRS